MSGGKASGKRTAQPEVEDTSLGLSGSSRGDRNFSFLMPNIRIGNVLVSARLDSGCDRSLVSSDFVEQHELQPLSALDSGVVSHLCAVDGRLVPSLGLLDLPVEMQGSRRRHGFLVMAHLPVPVIIGVDLMMAFEVSMNFARKDVQVGLPVRRVDVDEDSMLQTSLQAGPHATPLLEIFQRMPELFSRIPGSVQGIDHRIDVAGHRPIFQRPYPLPRDKAKIVTQQIEEMLDQGIIEPSESPWAAPIVLVPKKDHTWRFCVDYRALNAVTVEDRYPLPLIPVILRDLGGARYWTTLLDTGKFRCRRLIAKRLRSSRRTDCISFE